MQFYIPALELEELILGHYVLLHLLLFFYDRMEDDKAWLQKRMNLFHSENLITKCLLNPSIGRAKVSF